MNRIIMLFLGFVITGCVDMHAFGQGKFDSIPANNIQASDAEAAVLKLAGVIKSKDIYGALDKVCEEVERALLHKKNEDAVKLIFLLCEKKEAAIPHPELETV